MKSTSVTSLFFSFIWPWECIHAVFLPLWQSLKKHVHVVWSRLLLPLLLHPPPPALPRCPHFTSVLLLNCLQGLYCCCTPCLHPMMRRGPRLYFECTYYSLYKPLVPELLRTTPPGIKRPGIPTLPVDTAGKEITAAFATNIPCI